MDRNQFRDKVEEYMALVAPLTGSVDRNITLTYDEDHLPIMSLPSRGAWIEISLWPKKRRKPTASLPSRGAWIEIRGSLERKE